MGLLDAIGSITGTQQNEGSGTGNMAGAVMQALQQHPGGLGGVLDSFRQNGLSDHANALATGEQRTTTPEQVQQGLGGTGVIESVAQKAGVSPQVAQMAIAALMPMVINHFTQTGQAPDEGHLGMAQQILSRFL